VLQRKHYALRKKFGNCEYYTFSLKKTSYLKNEAAHIRDFGCLLLETLEEVLRQDEVSLLPSAEVNKD
jgi:hypothetical protein